MRNLLGTFYAIQISEEIFIEERVAFKGGNNIYLTTLATNNKAIHMEQSLLAYHLVENGYHQTAYPIPNQYGEWITNYRDENYLVLKLTHLKEEYPDGHGKRLAQFHKRNNTYAYEPQHISSYGQWKDLWINKLTSFENKIIEESKENKNNYYRLLVDVLPYVIGMSENAIQYMDETGGERRHDPSDQGTITFGRYHGQLLRPVIWHTDLVYDHFTRDVAEFMRYHFLHSGEQAFEKVGLFLKDYQSVHPLSILSWRMLYARLIYPVHFFDLIEQAFAERNYGKHYQQLQQMVDIQSTYEQCLCQLFNTIGVNIQALKIPVLQWL